MQRHFDDDDDDADANIDLCLAGRQGPYQAIELYIAAALRLLRLAGLFAFWGNHPRQLE
jgi:hypothetical protein